MAVVALRPHGLRTTPDEFFTSLAARGVRVRSFGREVGRFARFWPRSRNHSRMYVVGRRRLHRGPRLGDEWLPAARARGRLAGRVLAGPRGPVVEDFARLFAERWSDAARSSEPVAMDTGERYPDVRLISDAPGRGAQVYGAHLERSRRRASASGCQLLLFSTGAGC
jgi:phosphatidylserine/phosphatidylglycerophosphate/cardiolipin synthase-like enzyme